MSEQTHLDQFFSSKTTNTRSSGKRPSKDDDFDQIFQLGARNKRRRANNTTVADERSEAPPAGSMKKKRSSFTDEQETAEIEEVFSTTNRKRVRRSTGKSEDTVDLLNMFQTKGKDLSTPLILSHKPSPTTATKQKKNVKLFFDETEVNALRDEEEQEQKAMKEYIQIQPVLITGGHWLSKEAEATTSSRTETTAVVSDDQRNLMNVQYLPLILDQPVGKAKKSKSSSFIDGKSFHKQLLLSDSDVLRKENLQSCYNALLEEINKPRLPSASPLPDNDEEKQCDFFDLPTRKKRF